MTQFPLEKAVVCVVLQAYLFATTICMYIYNLTYVFIYYTDVCIMCVCIFMCMHM